MSLPKVSTNHYKHFEHNRWKLKTKKKNNVIFSLNFVKNRQGPISVIIESKEKASNWLKLPDHEIKSALKYLKAQTTIIFPVKKT